MTAPQQATVLEGEWLNTNKLWPARVDSDRIARLSMDEVSALRSVKLNSSSPLMRFFELFEKVD